MAKPGCVGLHGDGIRTRWVTTAVDLDGHIVFEDVLTAFRRFWCPACRRGCLVGHPGLVPRISVSVCAIAEAVHAAAPPPLGKGRSEIDIQQRVRRSRTAPPISERARSGNPRWPTLRRWVRTLQRWWPTLTMAADRFGARLIAFTAAIGPGLTGAAFLEAALRTHLRSAAAM